MDREKEIQLIEMLGGKVVPFTDEMRKALDKEQRVVCPHGNEGDIRHREVELIDRKVTGTVDGWKVGVRSEFYCEGDGDALHFACSCGDCVKEHPGGLSWFLPGDIEVDYL